MLEIHALDAEGFHPKRPTDGLGQLAAASGVVVWVDMIDPSQRELRVVAEQFQLHALALEDALEPFQRPKLEHYPTHSFVVLYSYVDDPGELVEVDVFLGHDWLVTVRNRNPSGAAYDPSPVRRRFERDSPAHVSVGYLLYVLVHDVADKCFSATDTFTDQMAVLEAEIFSARVQDEERIQRSLLHQRGERLLVRRRLAPMCDVLQAITRHDIAWIDAAMFPYFEDIHDRLLRTIDLIDLQRELLGNAVDAHLAMVSNRVNAVMRKMTAGGSILLGATLVTSIYGMGFDNIPGLHTSYGYVFALVAMVAISVVLLIVFRRSHWL